MPAFRRRPTEIEAIQWTGDNSEFDQATDFAKPTIVGSNGDALYLYAKSGVQLVVPGDWIVKEVDGSGAYAITPTIFNTLYEPLEEFDHAEMRA